MQKKKANTYCSMQEIEQQKKKLKALYTELKSTQAQLIQSEKMASLGNLLQALHMRYKTL